ncbi:MAG: ribonuclease III [Myxococcaceae bacterium]
MDTALERVQSLEARIGQELPDKKSALSAITHKSYLNEHPTEGQEDNERLEFLGDAVIDLAISHRLMERFPNAKEGELSRLRALIVNEDGLARVAKQLDLGTILLLGRGETMDGGAEKPSLLADALEAVIGSLYKASGMTAVLTFVDRHFKDALEGVAEGRIGLDYKSRLQETAQIRLKQMPRYRVVTETGPAHSKVFEVEVSIGEQTYSRATGKSKKEAEQAAAKATLSTLDAQQGPDGKVP